IGERKERFNYVGAQHAHIGLVLYFKISEETTLHYIVAARHLIARGNAGKLHSVGLIRAMAHHDGLLAVLWRDRKNGARLFCKRQPVFNIQILSLPLLFGTRAVQTGVELRDEDSVRA